MTTSHTPMQKYGTTVRLHGGGGFDVRGCDDAEALTDTIVRACNSHDQLMAALEDMLEWAREVSDEYIDGGDLRKEYRQSLSDARDALAAGRGAK